MACGLTPDLARMLAQMSEEKERKVVEAEQQLHETTKHIKQVKQKIAKIDEKSQQKKEQSGYVDWTYTYEKWDAWEDPEELARKEQEARERSEHAAKAQIGCNHDHSAEQKLMDMSTVEKLAACDEFRKLGNLFYEQGQFQRAAYHYHKALVYFEYIFPDNEPENEQLDALKLKVLLNFAACRLKTSHLDDVIHHTTEALSIDAENIKALYRRAQAYRLRDEFDLAMTDIAKAIDLASHKDPLLVQEKTLLQAKIAAYKLKSRQVSSAMFGGDKSANGTRKNDVSRKYGSGLTMPDSSAMLLDLKKTAAASSSSSGAISFDSWQPNTCGLKELETVISSLQAYNIKSS